MQILLDQIGNKHDDVVAMMRGTPLIGKIPTCGTGIKISPVSIRVTTVGYLKSIENDSEVFAQTRDEAVLGRMIQPVAVNAVREPGVISKRSPVPQSSGVRCVDDLTTIIT